MFQILLLYTVPLGTSLQYSLCLHFNYLFWINSQKLNYWVKGRKYFPDFGSLLPTSPPKKIIPIYNSTDNI